MKERRGNYSILLRASRHYLVRSDHLMSRDLVPRIVLEGGFCLRRVRSALSMLSVLAFRARAPGIRR